MTSTLDPDARQHQQLLQSITQTFIKLIKSDDHDKLHYWDYIKDMKFLLVSHVLQLQGCESKDVVKMIKLMIHDPESKFLCPTESAEDSNSDEGMPQEFDTPSKANIMAEFPREMLTPEVRTNIVNIIEHMEVSHNEAAKVMKCMKKLVPTILVGTFHLILQAMVQPHIMIQHWWLCCIKSGEQEKHCTASLVNMVQDGSKSQNLPNPVWTLAAILHYQVKNEAGIKVSIPQTAKLFGTQEKLFHQALKGVCHEPSTQKHRHLDAAHDKKEESSSCETEDDDDDDEDEGAVTKIKPLKKHKKSCGSSDEKWSTWHWSHLPVFLWALYTHQFLLVFKILSKFSLPGFHLDSGSPCQKLKSHMKFKIQLIQIILHLNVSKSSPLHCQKSNTKHHKMFFQTKKKTP